MNTKLRSLAGALVMALAMLFAVVVAPTFAQGPATNLTVTDTPDAPEKVSGDTVIYTIDVTTGITPATNLVVIDTLPSNMSVVSANNGGIDNGNGTVTWNLGDVSGSVALQLEVQLDANAPAGIYSNAVEVTADNADPAISGSDITVSEPAVDIDLAIVKTVSNSAPNSGSTVVYSLQVTNNSATDNATGVIVDDTLPAGVTYDTSAGDGTYDGATWAIGDLAAGQTATLNITGTVTAGEGIPVDNTASVSGNEQDTATGNNTDSASFTVAVPVITTSPVTVTVNSASGPAAGQHVVVYTVDTNSGITAPTTISDTTDGSGMFTFNLAAGDYVFTVNNSGFDFSSATCSVPACDTATVDLFTAVEVSVVDTAGTAVVSQTVTVYDDTATELQSAQTDGNGIVLFNLGVGSYSFVAADAPGNAVVCDTPTCTSVTIEIPVFGLVDVTVTDGIGVVLSKTVEVYLVNPTTGATTTQNISDMTDASGIVSFNLPAGSYQFAAADAAQTLFFSSICEVPTCTTASLVLANLNPVTVTVRGDTGAGVSGQVVSVLLAGTDTGITRTTEASGTVNLDLPAGTYQFSTEYAGSTYLSASCELPGCTDALITLPASEVRLPADTCALNGSVRSCEFWAVEGTLSLPGNQTVNVWGYTDVDGGAPQLPGPMIIANEGETVEVTLHNALSSETTSILFKGLNMVPDLTGVGPGGTKTYTFAADNPGTFLYQAGLTDNGNRQVAMGLYGALIIRPTAGVDQLYNNSSTTFDDEALVLVSEIDPKLHDNPTSFDLRMFKPQYWLINGKAYPDTAPIQVMSRPDDPEPRRVALRYLNAGLEFHSMGVLGLAQTLHGVDGEPLPGARNVVAETLASGQTLDAIVSVPVGTEQDTRFAVYDTSLLLHNGTDTGFGGMLTFLSTFPDGTVREPGGPSVTDVTITPSSTAASVDVSIFVEKVTDLDNGGDNIQAVEFFVSSPGADGAGTDLTASDGSFDSPVEDAEGVIPASALDSLPSGYHTIYVHGQDMADKWGAFHPVVLHLDKNGPRTVGLELSPNPGGGNGQVTLTGTADDRDTGNSNVDAARYTINGQTFAMAVNIAAPVAGLNGLIDVNGLNLAEGVYPVSVESHDVFGHWGDATVINLIVDKTAPETLAVELLPAANNGMLSVNPSLFSMRVNASVSEPAGDIQSSIRKVEGFINYQPGTDADGSGFPLTPADGKFDSATEDAYAFIPLSTINALADGDYTIGIHAQDASGNWGTVVNTALIIERTSPAVSGLVADPNPTVGLAEAALAATATDNRTAITFAEWFVGADPGQGNGNPMAVAAIDAVTGNLSAVVNVAGWADGDYTIFVRARDAAGNWSAVVSTVLTVGAAPTPEAKAMYFSTLASGNTVNIPGVPWQNDQDDVFHWVRSTELFDRIFDASEVGVPVSNIDGLKVDGDNIYMSFDSNVTLTNGQGVLRVRDEDIVVYNPVLDDVNPWDFYFVGVDTCLRGNQDIDGFDIVGDVVYFSLNNNSAVDGVPGQGDDADIYAWNGTACSRVFDARGGGVNLLPNGANIDGLTVVDNDTFYMSFSASSTSITGIGTVQDEDVVLYDQGVWSILFDGGAYNLTNWREDLDAVDVHW